jgi:hypothetical protein
VGILIHCSNPDFWGEEAVASILDIGIMEEILQVIQSIVDLKAYSIECVRQILLTRVRSRAGGSRRKGLKRPEGWPLSSDKTPN